MNKELLLSLGDRIVKIDRGGPESRVGKILAVEDDHLTVLTEDDGVVYYNTHHIKSLTDNAKEEMEFDFEVPEDFEFIRAKDFKGVLENLRFTWVQINRGGPEMLEGVLYEINDDFVAIVAHEEVIRLSMFHIRNISYGNKVEKTKSEE
ncbi:hypothetical protein [Virgibacillus halodenitrificans]|uniref:hypothetical protein n=1 Tax=Virgibacillus halodenitrificans TaxID=1482 RepID=UPI002DB90D96|nr:hypothetical protein [Virgibacillus halodenitrificans]MEC2159377.1 hypothetical protein [Virgibacillus halodenitrificans]